MAKILLIILWFLQINYGINLFSICKGKKTITGNHEPYLNVYRNMINKIIFVAGSLKLFRGLFCHRKDSINY